MIFDLDELVRRSRTVPPHTSFPTIDALLDAFADLERDRPELISSRRIGTSRLGEPIMVYTVGAADDRLHHDHLIIGGVHPNEPIGSITALHLATTLADDGRLLGDLDTRWHIVPCIDPDGMRLNEGWFADPTDRTHYARWFYRPAPDEQVEWSFPFAYKDAYFDAMLPETQGLMRLIDAVEPRLYVSLHNGEFGGVYYYLSREVPELVEPLHAVPAAFGLPLDTGEPESPHLQTYAPAIFATGTLADAYDFLEDLGLDAASQMGGSSSGEYAAERHGALGLVAELPFWGHPAADDQTPVDESYDDLVTRTGHDLGAMAALLHRILTDAEPLLGIDSPFRRASRAFLPMLGHGAEADLARAAKGDGARPATVAERFGREDLVRCFKLRYGGMLLRALDVESAAGTAPVAVRRLRDELASVYGEWLEAARIETPDAWVIPIERLVGVQYGAILAAAAHLADDTRSA